MFPSQSNKTCPVSQSWLSSSSIFFDLDQESVDEAFDEVDVIDDLDDVDAFLTSSASICFSWLLPRLSSELPPNESGWKETEQTCPASDDGMVWNVVNVSNVFTGYTVSNDHNAFN